MHRALRTFLLEESQLAHDINAFEHFTMLMDICCTGRQIVFGEIGATSEAYALNALTYLSETEH